MEPLPTRNHVGLARHNFEEGLINGYELVFRVVPNSELQAKIPKGYDAKLKDGHT